MQMRHEGLQKKGQMTEASDLPQTQTTCVPPFVNAVKGLCSHRTLWECVLFKQISGSLEGPPGSRRPFLLEYCFLEDSPPSVPGQIRTRV